MTRGVLRCRGLRYRAFSPRRGPERADVAILQPRDPGMDGVPGRLRDDDRALD